MTYSFINVTPDATGLSVVAGDAGTAAVFAHATEGSVTPDDTLLVDSAINGRSLAVTSPVVTVPNTRNYGGSSPFYPPNTAVSDADMMVAATSGVSFSATVTGDMNIVEVWIHNTQKLLMTPDASGNVSGTLDLSAEYNGPLVIDVYASNGGPFQIQQRLLMFITGGATWTRPTPSGAAGFSQTFIDDFTTSPPSIATSATDFSKTWYTHQLTGFDYGDAVFENYGGPHDLFKQFSPSFLRIRSLYDANGVDPFGFGRLWFGGEINAMQNTSPPTSPVVPTVNTTAGGYVEARFMGPKGETPWPTVWTNPLASNIISEIDICEAYGLFTNVMRPTFFPKNRANATTPGLAGTGGAANAAVQIPTLNAAGVATSPIGGDWAWEFHTFGYRIGPPGAADAGMFSVWIDDVQVQEVDASGNFTGTPWLVPIPSGTADDLAIEVTHPRGSGFPEVPSPAGYEDMWVDYVSVWQ